MQIRAAHRRPPYRAVDDLLRDNVVRVRPASPKSYASTLRKHLAGRTDKRMDWRVTSKGWLIIELYDEGSAPQHVIDWLESSHETGQAMTHALTAVLGRARRLSITFPTATEAERVARRVKYFASVSRKGSLLVLEGDGEHDVDLTLEQLIDATAAGWYPFALSAEPEAPSAKPEAPTPVDVAAEKLGMGEPVSVQFVGPNNRDGFVLQLRNRHIEDMHYRRRKYALIADFWVGDPEDPWLNPEFAAAHPPIYEHELVE